MPPVIDLTEAEALRAPPRKRRRRVADLTADEEPAAAPAQKPQAPAAEPVLPLPEAENHTCLLCFEETSWPLVFTASACHHSLCGTCAKVYVVDAIQSSTIPVPCPLCSADAGPACTKRCKAQKVAGAVTAQWCCSLDADLWQLLTSSEMEMYQQRACSAAALHSEDLRSCPQADCQGIAVKEAERPRLVCCACEHEWCGHCNTPDMHPGKTCEQLAQEKSAVEAESGFQEYTAEHRVVHCPTCKHGLQRSEGCNRLRCMCGTQLCWLCGVKLHATDPYSHYKLRGPCFQRVYG